MKEELSTGLDNVQSSIKAAQAFLQAVAHETHAMADANRATASRGHPALARIEGSVNDNNASPQQPHEAVNADESDLATIRHAVDVNNAHLVRLGDRLKEMPSKKDLEEMLAKFTAPVLKKVIAIGAKVDNLRTRAEVEELLKGHMGYSGMKTEMKGREAETE